MVGRRGVHVVGVERYTREMRENDAMLLLLHHLGKREGSDIR